MDAQVIYRCAVVHAMPLMALKVTMQDGRDYVIPKGTPFVVRPQLAHRAALKGLVRRIDVATDMEAAVWPASTQAQQVFRDRKDARFDVSHDTTPLVAQIELYKDPGPPKLFKAFEHEGGPPADPVTGFESPPGP